MKPPQAPMHRAHWPSPQPQSLLCARHNLTLCLGAWGTDLAAMWHMGGTDCSPSLAPGLLLEAGPLAPGSLWLASALLTGQHTGRFRANHTRAPSLGVVAVPGGLAWSLEQAGVHSHVSPWPLRGTAVPLWATTLSLGTRFMCHKEDDT